MRKTSKETTTVKQSATRARKATAEQQAMVRMLWEAGLGTIPEISEDVGLSLEQVKYLLREKGWVQGKNSDYYEQKAQDAIERQMEAKVRDLISKKDQAREKAVSLSSLIENNLIGIFKHIKEDGLREGTAVHDFKALETASRIVQNCFHTKRFALGMFGEDENGGADQTTANKIEVLEMTADEIEQIQRNQEKELEEMDTMIDED